jgi:signal transduction histidine kinase
LVQTSKKKARLRDDSQGFDATCEVDRHAVSQVFRNILENCLAAADEPVEVVVGCEASVRNGAPAVSVTVRDNGPGFTSDALQRVFEPFFTTKTQGTGLGMAIAKRIVESHGGEIRAGNHPAGGAEFEIHLPRRAL